MQEKAYYVYIITNKKHGVLYIGITSDIQKRIYEHKTKSVDGFSSKYNLHKLVYYEQFSDAYSAISREKQLKKWRRQWKIDLIETQNPQWCDFYDTMF